ncbi:hypothetical protein [Devosia crocina]|nr:hypothetical protein [Devosia crocina]
MQQMRTEIIDAADMLQGLGLPADQAFTVVVHHSVRTACAMAMDVAIADGREPNLANWQAATTETFNKVLERWHQLTESGEPPDA